MSRAYSGIDIDMDLIAPFLSATHMFIDETSNETLRTIDTATNRYIWEANDHLLFVMVVSKAARVSHMRFLLQYAMSEFITNEVPVGMNVETVAPLLMCEQLHRDLVGRRFAHELSVRGIPRFRGNVSGLWGRLRGSPVGGQPSGCGKRARRR